MSWGRHRGGGGDWGGWAPYVPVAERRAKARQHAEKMKKKGEPLAPVIIARRTIAATFWGKAWCENLERYGDYENRIPRGRTYVRNGSVIDLQIGKAQVTALVSGSHLYSVEIAIKPLKPSVWTVVKGKCMGRIGSLLELLQGRLSREVMEVVTMRSTGLFPEPAEISFTCSCPDWASMCKHVAAVFYGVGARLDIEPELLFKLRNVDHRELIAAPGSVSLAASTSTKEKLIAEEDLAEIFGIDLDGEETAVKKSAPKTRRKQAIPVEIKEKRAPLRGRRSKPADSLETPQPPKRKRGRPRLTEKVIKVIAVEAVAPPLPEKPKRGRPKLARKAGETNRTLVAPERSKPKRVTSKRDSLPARKRGRPPGKKY
jgi:uncharacterized Zn finger protein